MITRRTVLLSAFVASSVGLAACSSYMSTNTTALGGDLSAKNEVPMNASAGTGRADADFNKETNVLTWKVSYAGLTGPVTAAHIHGPAAAGANAGVMIPFSGNLASPFEGKATLTPAQAADVLAGRTYVNLHTAANPGGEVRAQLVAK